MEAEWCANVLSETIEKHGNPEIFNTDQGSQFTSDVFTKVLFDNERFRSSTTLDSIQKFPVQAFEIGFEKKKKLY